MLLAGDEFGQTQRGNNNAYCQDNEISWLDWDLAAKNSSLVEFVGLLSDLRRSRLWLRRDTFLKGTRRSAAARDITWLHPSGREMTETDWADGSLSSLAVQMGGSAYGRAAPDGDLLAVFNADDAPLDMQLPAASRGENWRVLIDTAATSPVPLQRLLHCKETLRVEARCTVLLESDGPPG